MNKLSRIITRTTSILGFTIVAFLIPQNWYATIGQVVVAFAFATFLEFSLLKGTDK